MKKEIRIAYGELVHLELDDIHILQGELVELSDEEYVKLARNIIETDFAFAPHVWLDPADDKYKLVDGTQRKKVMTKLRDEDGYKIPKIPCVPVLAPTYKAACERVLQGRSQFGKMTDQGLYEFIHSNGLEIDRIVKNYTFPEFSLPNFSDYFFGGGPSGNTGEGGSSGGGASAEASAGGGDLYTKKIKSPIYEPSGPKPAVSDLYNLEKANAMVEKIQKSNLPQEEKDFLMAAATRHTVFNYRNIAEYYAHSSKEAQELMEESALVIIDFKKAIENGFVALSEALGEAYDTEEKEAAEEEGNPE